MDYQAYSCDPSLLVTLNDLWKRGYYHVHVWWCFFGHPTLLTCASKGVFPKLISFKLVAACSGTDTRTASWALAKHYMESGYERGRSRSIESVLGLKGDRDSSHGSDGTAAAATAGGGLDCSWS